MRHFFKKDFEELGVSPKLYVRDRYEDKYIEINDTSNGGRVEIPYKHIPEFKRFLKSIIDNKIELPLEMRDSDSLQLEYVWMHAHPRKIRNFYSNWIRTNKFKDIIKIIDNVSFGIGKVVFTHQELVKYDVGSLLYIQKRTRNRKIYKQEEGVKYLDI